MPEPAALPVPGGYFRVQFPVPRSDMHSALIYSLLCIGYGLYSIKWKRKNKAHICMQAAGLNYATCGMGTLPTPHPI